MGIALASVVVAAIQVPAGLEEARAYAPIVWLANNEPAYPMLPNAFAFDAIDNDCDGKFDLEDPSEVYTEDDMPSIGEFASMLLDADEQRRRHYENDWVVRGTVVHRHPKGLLEIPESCPQPRAYGMPAPGSGGVDRSTKLVEPYFGPQPRVLFVGQSDRESILGWNTARAAVPPNFATGIGRRTTLLQYWLYYPFDMGPNPHRHDGEHVSVFVERDEDGHPRVRAVVGAGHESNNVNNALIAAALDTHPSPNLVLPRQLRDHMPILVELGKHASAPDADCNGRFDLGADANIYSESVWGSRDVWAGSAGKTLKVGRFETWFSFPRDRNRRYLLDGWWKTGERNRYREACPDLIQPYELPPAPDWAANAPRSGAEKPPENTPPMVDEEMRQRLEALDEQALEHIARTLARTYELFPLRDLYELHETLASAECRDDEECSTVLETFFATQGRKESFWGARAPDRVRVSREVARRMKTWVRDKGRHLERRDVWKHEAFRRPATDFRVWLFKRLGIGFVSKIEGGNLVSGGVVRIADLLAKDSRLELYVHFDRLASGRAGRLYDAGIDVFSSRTRFFGVYFGFGYNEDFNTKAFGSAGLNFYLANLPQLKLPRDLSFSLFAGINGELFRETSGESRRAEALRFQVGGRVIWGFWGPRHPLAR